VVGKEVRAPRNDLFRLIVGPVGVRVALQELDALMGPLSANERLAVLGGDEGAIRAKKTRAGTAFSRNGEAFAA
jgi:hypothetical protein